MSYSRWTSSQWYSFWNIAALNDTKDEQLLSLWYDMSSTPSFTYAELKDITTAKLMEYFPEASIDDCDEALSLISQFIVDVDHQYDTTAVI